MLSASPAARASLRRLHGSPSSALCAARRAALTTSLPRRKSAADSVKQGLKSVDRTVSDNIVLPGLDAAAKVKEKAEQMTKGQAKGQAKGKAEELKGQAKGAAHEAAGKVKGAVEEAKKKL